MNFFSTYPENKIRFLMNDFIIAPELCNFNCDYCIYEEAPEYKKEHTDTKETKIRTVYDKEGSNEEFFLKTGKVLKGFDNTFHTPILRICGGELFYMKDIISFIESIHANYEKVQIISNGYFLDHDTLSRIKNLKNCILHISLDGHTQNLNRRRIKNKKLQERLIHHIETIIKLEIPLEIASCLTDANTAEYEEMVKFFSKFNGKILLLPFPVRGEECKEFYPSQKDIESFSKLTSKFDDYKEILPPYRYIERLCEFYQAGRRTKKCQIPKTIVQTFHNGDIASCCMDWSVKIANAQKNNQDEIAELIGKNKIYNMYSINPPRLISCKQCFTVSEIINLYFDNEITKKDLERMELYNGEESLKVLDHIKKQSEQYLSTNKRGKEKYVI